MPIDPRVILLRQHLTKSASYFQIKKVKIKMLVEGVKHSYWSIGQQCEYTARIFKMSNSTLERQVSKYVQLIGSLIFNTFGRQNEKMYTVRKLRNVARKFKRSKFVRYNI